MDKATRQYYRALYERLSQHYTAEELAAAFVFPPDVDEETANQEAANFAAWRKQRLAQRTPRQRLLAALLQLRYDIEAELSLPQATRLVPHFLRAYLRAIGYTQQDLAQDLDVAPARLSRILHGKERLSLALAYRLERHSGELIPALLWWKLAQRAIEQEIMSDTDERAQEQQRVKRVVYEEEAG